MAAKPATADPKAAGASGNAAQIMQSLASIAEKLSALEASQKAQSDNITKTLEGQKQMAVALASVDQRLASLDVQVKASAGTKRPPKTPGEGNAGTAAPSGPVNPTGEKFFSTSPIWFNARYKQDPVATRDKFFNDLQVKAMLDKMGKTKEYTDIVASGGTPEANEAGRVKRLVMEARALLDVAKAEAEIAAKIKAAWSEEKSAFERANATKVKKDSEKPSTPADKAPETNGDGTAS